MLLKSLHIGCIVEMKQKLSYFQNVFVGFLVGYLLHVQWITRMHIKFNPLLYHLLKSDKNSYIQKHIQLFSNNNAYAS